MVHNHKAGGSGSGGGVNNRPLNFNTDKASILAENNILVWAGACRTDGGSWWAACYAPHSAGGASSRRLHRAMPARLPPEQCDHPHWVANNVLRRQLFQQERQDAINEFDMNAPFYTRFTISSRRAWWRSRSV
jgi:hypothetical protein